MAHQSPSILLKQQPWRDPAKMSSRAREGGSKEQMAALMAWEMHSLLYIL